MEQTALTYRKPLVLSDEAYSFGIGVWEPGRRGAGTLTLTEDRLRFTPREGGRVVEIPLNRIDSLGVTARCRRGPRLESVLRITYRKNLLFGVAVEQPAHWIDAIRNLTGAMGRPARAEHPTEDRSPIRRFRLVVALILLLIVLIGTALPLFFSWMSVRVMPPHTASRTAFPETPTGT